MSELSEAASAIRRLYKQLESEMNRLRTESAALVAAEKVLSTLDRADQIKDETLAAIAKSKEELALAEDTLAAARARTTEDLAALKAQIDVARQEAKQALKVAERDKQEAKEAKEQARQTISAAQSDATEQIKAIEAEVVAKAAILSEIKAKANALLGL